MGLFTTPVACAGGAATSYYKSAPGANFGGFCKNLRCPSQALAEKQVAHNAGMVHTSPFRFQTLCPACQEPFQSTWLWFYSTRVELIKVEGPVDVFDVRGTDMRRVEIIWGPENRGDMHEFRTSP